MRESSQSLLRFNSVLRVSIGIEYPDNTFLTIARISSALPQDKIPFIFFMSGDTAGSLS